MQPLRTVLMPAMLALTMLAMAGCARPTPMPDAFPDDLAAWHRVGPVRDLPPAESPDSLPGARIEQIRAASYAGQGKLDARVYALSSPAVSLDAVQRWTPRPDTVTFHADRFFVVVHWHVTGKRELQAFLSALEKRFSK